MILLVYFFLTFVAFALIAFALTERGLRGPWQKQGPYHVAEQARRRNRIVLIVAAVVAAVSVLMEWFIVDYHERILDAQYGVGDAFGWDPLLIQETATGGVSWGLYLVLLLGVFAGLVAGTAFAARRYAIMRGTSWTAYA